MEQLDKINIIMIHIRTDPVVFTWKDIEQFKQDNPRTEYCLECEYQGTQYAIFYGGFPCRYQCAYYTDDQWKWADKPAVETHNKDCEWIEDLEFVAVQADNGDVIYSRYPTERRNSDDGSCWVRGSSVSDPSRKRTITLYKGRVEYWQ